MITLIGKHPRNNRLNIYVTMFFKVLKSFFSFLSWYGLFLIAFGLSFFILLHQDVEHEGAATDSEYPYFNSTFLSVVKTMTMFVGELEFSDIPISLETISYLESVLLGDPFDFLSNVPRYLSAVPSCSVFRQLYRSNTLRKVFTKLGASNILLFYNYLPEKRSPVIRPNNKLRDCGCLSADEMGQDTIEAAKKIISRKSKVDENNADLSQLAQKILEIEQKLNSISSVEYKLDILINKLSR